MKTNFPNHLPVDQCNLTFSHLLVDVPVLCEFVSEQQCKTVRVGSQDKRLLGFERPTTLDSLADISHFPAVTVPPLVPVHRPFWIYSSSQFASALRAAATIVLKLIILRFYGKVMASNIAGMCASVFWTIRRRT